MFVIDWYPLTRELAIKTRKNTPGRAKRVPAYSTVPRDRPALYVPREARPALCPGGKPALDTGPSRRGEANQR